MTSGKKEEDVIFLQLIFFNISIRVTFSGTELARGKKERKKLERSRSRKKAEEEILRKVPKKEKKL